MKSSCLFTTLFLLSFLTLVRGSNDGNSTCAANDLCSNLVGECCPSDGGFDLFCCDTTEGSCATNPRCVEANVTGECCPTTQNVFLDCCERGFAKCTAHPRCAHLANDCCPTASGVFLDCCRDDETLDDITFPPNDAARACSANAACVGLADDCCPTADGTYLYCCGEAPRTSGYEVERTLASPSINEDDWPLSYLVSSSTVQIPDSRDGRNNVIGYYRNSSLEFDLIYFETSFDNVIPDATAFTNSSKKFYIDLWTDAPACTQVLLQLDNLPRATKDNFPEGRQSRYLTFTTKSKQWERLEFDWLDILDHDMDPKDINALALFFDPGNTDTYQYYFDFLDITQDGCIGPMCEMPSIKNCSAYFGGEDEEELRVETDEPTSSPVSQPTTSPTKQPTSSPTSMPTSSPTQKPTSIPTNSPIASPTSNPTEQPTSLPTELPTSLPSATPTTAAPTSLPTNFPTTQVIATTDRPTSSPTLSPTANPTSSPTFMPTSNPTATPTMNPTYNPTSDPTMSPTFNPTDSPTINPTAIPTTSPTINPTEEPTPTPTASPTPEPTEIRPLLRDAPACADGLDNDGDGLPDCSDPDCCLTIQCWGLFQRSYSTASYQLEAGDATGPAGTSSVGGPRKTIRWSLLSSGWLILVAFWYMG